MFKSISWQQYLYVVGVLSFTYYVLIIAIFYSRDILLKFKGSTVTKPQEPNSTTESARLNFMGAISKSVPKKIPVKESIAAGEELVIESDPEELMAAQRADSPAAELFERLDETFQIMEGEHKKANYLKNIKTLIRQYDQFKDTSIQKEISAFICERFKEHPQVTFATEEIDVLWLDEKEEIIIQSTTINNHEK